LQAFFAADLTRDPLIQIASTSETVLQAHAEDLG
jgi:hypothetical protein